MRKHRHSEIIDALGGTTAVARLCGVTLPTVSGWRKRGIPRGWLAFLQERQPNIVEAGAAKNDK